MQGVVARGVASRVGALGVALLAVVAIAGCNSGALTNLERLSEARRLSAEMLVQFTKSADAGNRAVMAETDESSAAFAREAEEATAGVAKDGEVLGPVLRAMGYAEEGRLLEEFGKRLAEYRALDHDILQLAVENTNLKAQRLSFGPVMEVADAFRNALQGVEASAAAGQEWHVASLAATALADVREIQVLQAPHIAESDEEAMTRLEKRAAEREASARRSLGVVAGLVKPAARTQVAAATAALDRLVELNGQIVVLSRRNSNVRSLALSLGQKRTLTATCEESLRALVDALGRRGFTGTK